jgi:hypothetical protein
MAHSRLLSKERVPVPVCLRLTRQVVRAVRVLVVLVMYVRVAVLARLMRVPVLVMLGEVQPEPEAHERGGGEEQRASPLRASPGCPESGADERGEGEIGWRRQAA